MDNKFISVTTVSFSLTVIPADFLSTVIPAKAGIQGQIAESLIC